MTLRPAELLRVAAELARVLPGRSLQKVVSAGPDAIALGLHGAWLLVATDRRFGRVHLLPRKPPGTGEAAPAFVMLLRKELVGLRFTCVEAVPGQRALALEFERAPALDAERGVGAASHASGRHVRRLLVFLFGDGPRFVLLDGKQHVFGAFPPPAAGGAVPVELPPPRDDQRPARFPVEGTSAAIDEHYSAEVQGAGADSARVTAAAAARRTLEKLRRRETALASDLARLDGATARRRHADLLLAHLAEVPRGAAQVTLPDDFADGAPVNIALDPARSASDNAARIYHEYRRLSRARPVVEKRLADTCAERSRAEERLAAIESGDQAAIAGVTSRSDEPALAMRMPVGPRGRGAQPARAVPYRAFRSATGAPILVGKGATRNDELTFSVARGNDLWLHTRDVPGAHVVVPLAGRPVDEATLLDAATLALWFSPARPTEPLSDEAARQVQADVTYTQRKLVRKPRGAPPGRVSVAGGKTIRIRLEPERLRRLLASLATGNG